LTPAVFDVVAGQPVQVTVTNNGKVQHNLTEVYCPVPGHEDAGMKGVVHVSAATAPAGGANSTTGTPTALPTSGADFTNTWTLIAGIVGALLIAFGLGIGPSARQR
jgi:hypothetical protein